MTFAGARSFVLRSSDQTASQQPLIRKSRYIHEESVASRVQLRNPTTVHDRNVAVLHRDRACPLYGRQGTGSYLNLDETYSFLDHYDQKVLRHSLANADVEIARAARAAATTNNFIRASRS
jgi:hypothetical protein